MLSSITGMTIGLSYRLSHQLKDRKKINKTKQIKINNWYDNLIVIPIVIPVQNKTI